MDKALESVSVVIPAFNESATIRDVVEHVFRICAALGCAYEVIVVDDGSSDDTAALAEKAGATVLRHPYNKGYGASLKSGIRDASNCTVVILDSDGQHDPEDIKRLLAARRDAAMAVGARRGSAGSPLWRKPGKMVIGWLANQLTGRKIPDLNSGFRVMDRELLLRFLPIMPDGFSFSTTSTIALMHGGYTVNYIPIEVKHRGSGSTVTMADGLSTILLIFRLITLFAPLRICLPVSIVTAAIGCYYIVYGYVSSGMASIRGIMALLASVLFFLFGLLIDQVSAIRRGETVQR